MELQSGCPVGDHRRPTTSVNRGSGKYAAVSSTDVRQQHQDSNTVLSALLDNNRLPSHNSLILVEIESFYTDLGRRLRFHRERQQMTQAQLGMALRPATTRASIANIESGKQRVLAHTIVQMADALAISVGDLLSASSVAPENAVRDELFKKLELPRDQLSRVVEKLAPRRKKANR
jgi:transcriptional regulator with XRE-family HTH domain